jgi:membrane associated rhomboid family serine protease
MQWVNEQLRTIVSTMVLIVSTVPGLVFFSTNPGSAAISFGLQADFAHLPGRIYTLLTYAIIPGGFRSWLVTSVALLCTGILLERLLTRRIFWALVVLSTVLGGLLFVVQSRTPGILLGANHTAWALSGAMLVLAGIRWRSLRWPARLFLVATALSTLDWLLGLFMSPETALEVSLPVMAVFGSLVAAASLRRGVKDVPRSWPYNKPIRHAT